MTIGQQVHRSTTLFSVSAGKAPTDDFSADMLKALASRPRYLSPKHFYDEQGSSLFDQICELPEYYPTRAELSLLKLHAQEIAEFLGKDVEIVEFGAGSLQKIQLLLDAMDTPHCYVPIDISGSHLAAAAETLQRRYPELDVRPVVGDYTSPLRLPAMHRNCDRRVGFFPGSTIGNLCPSEALTFLKQARHLLRGGGLLLGVDLIKDPAILHAAYNDSQGVTAAFNRNVLIRANRELDANFEINAFAHSAFFNAPLQRVEMHLMSLRSQRVRVCDQTFSFAQGETLHTENSHKYTVDGLRSMAVKTGFELGPVWTDAQNQFCLCWLQIPF